MKILSITTNNSAGGASKACFRLHSGLLNADVDADLLMLEQPNHDIKRGHNFYNFYLQQQSNIYQSNTFIKKLNSKLLYRLGLNKEAQFDKKRKFENKLLAQKSKHLEVFTFSHSLYRIQDHPLYKEADIIHLHWVANNFLDYKSFFPHNKKPVVWTLHDMNPFTGGCHYAEDCEGFMQACTNCPQLQNTDDPSYSNKELISKLDSLSGILNVTIVSPSQWLLNLSKRSKLFGKFSHIHIPYGIDSNNFQPREKIYSRKILGIPEDSPVILFAALSIESKRKGYSLLLEAFQRLQLKDKVTLCAVGIKNNSTTFINTDFYELGSFSDERLMSIAYSAADIFVIPSLEDNLPNTVIESLLCGTPVIGFPTGGIKEMIEDEKNGYLCKDISVPALAEKLNKFLTGSYIFDRDKIRKDAVEKYDSTVQTKRYIKLYKELLEEDKN